MVSDQQLLSGLKGIIVGGISVKDFSAITKYDEQISLQILNEFIKHGIGYKDSSVFQFGDADKLKSVIMLLEKGISIDSISEYLHWRDFENLVAEILASKDFATIKNFIMTKPKMEIDVVGIRLGVTMLIDCKHWSRSSVSALKAAVRKQIERTHHYVSKTDGAIAVPVIVTLYQDKINFIDKVPIVPIFQFSSFVDEFYGNIDQMNTIQKD